MTIRILPLAALLWVAACSTTPPTVAMQGLHGKEGDEKDKDDLLFSEHRAGIPHVVVKEAWISTIKPEDNVDSPASWLQDGKLMVAATAKSTDQIIIYDGDTGRRLRAVGGPGNGLGELSRPNGIATVDDKYVFVVERDNHRVQMFSLPDFRPLLTFADGDLVQPYGLWVRKHDEGYEVIVSDNYTLGEDANGDDIIPPLAELGKRFRRYEVRQEGGGWTANANGYFGDTGKAGAIRVAESLFGDEANNRLLIAEEDVATGTRLREYTLDGKYAGRDVGAANYKAQAEGIALMDCKGGGGWWIASDQFNDRTVFHLFDRKTLEHVGSFVGHSTGLTDGVWLDTRGDARFPQGAFFASHLDMAVSAFDWRDIGKALRLPECT